jgi:thymidine phosphorylase
VHARDESAALLASLQYQGALVIDNKQAEQQPVIYQTISA